MKNTEQKRNHITTFLGSDKAVFVYCAIWLFIAHALALVGMVAIFTTDRPG